MPEVDHQHHQPRILDPADHPPVADPVAPEARQFAGQRPAARARIAGRGILDIGEQTRSGSAIELFERAFGTRAEINPPDLQAGAKLVLHRVERLDRRGIEFGPRLGRARIILEVEITPHRPRLERMRFFAKPRGGGEARIGGDVEGDGEHVQNCPTDN